MSTGVLGCDFSRIPGGTRRAPAHAVLTLAYPLCHCNASTLCWETLPPSPLKSTAWNSTRNSSREHTEAGSWGFAMEPSRSPSSLPCMGTLMAAGSWAAMSRLQSVSAQGLTLWEPCSKPALPCGARRAGTNNHTRPALLSSPCLSLSPIPFHSSLST